MLQKNRLPIVVVWHSMIRKIINKRILYDSKIRLLTVALAIKAREALITGKLQDGFTVLLMTETKIGIILTLENNTNPFDLLGNCRSCLENWMNRRS